MALISCPSCGLDISEKAKRCPYCGKNLKKNKFIIPIIGIGVLFGICVSVLFGWKKYQKVQGAKIEKLLIQVDDAYSMFNFDEIEECYNALDDLHYDTSEQRKILEYDRRVYNNAYAYYLSINDVNKRLHSGGYTSLRTLVNKMISPTRKFEALEINTDSEIGKYIRNVRSNVMYTMLNSQFVNSTECDLDYYLTSWGYAEILKTYTEEIVKVKFPYSEEE